ncbi:MULTISPECIES: hypothetical protein [Nostoc]|uniref:Transposase n=1 Tax=Nostoc paludosum FACHB-159 TaxID=2692908 RepID=A0ABR8KM97_9NOSO|nr:MULTISPECIES: hypothetical protein [Nostoc]MBD2682713.1 hypothetical protein [Nostoc sp. FACHB-857]MBD2739047.1 hypothetical protein [Nostoc paludosum FACHB-159]
MKTIQLPYTKPLTRKTQFDYQANTQNQLFKLLNLEVFVKFQKLTNQTEVDLVLACSAACRYLLIALVVLLALQ